VAGCGCELTRVDAGRLFTPSFDMNSLRGHLLISSGGLYDPNFRHTVVLIGEHNEDGALGVVLNRALEVSVADAVPELASWVPEAEPLFQGGPVQPESPVLLVETDGPAALDLAIFDNIGFLIGDVPPEPPPEILRARLFAGYSGWGPGQLEAEMATDSWIVEPARVEDAFTDNPELLWSRVLHRKGPQYRRLSKMPFDPSMN
jgi:putative transcriptional regulator